MTTTPTLARYQVLGRLATGGMAEVWLARSVGIAGFEKLVVVKTILPQLAQNPQFVAMFVNEARLAAMLTHPNCVQIFDLGQEREVLYIAMEYLEGFSLARVLKRAKLKGVAISENLIARIIMDAASGLDYAHRLKDREGRHVGLVHRDVSPDNLLVGFSGQVKVVDFGIAKAATPALLATATTAGTVKGKHGYIAPEYLLGLPLDGRADVFALGVVLYRALTGKRPFNGPTEAAISLAVVQEQPRPPLEWVPTLNPALATVVMMALEKEPAARFESARAMRQAVEAAVVHAAENEEVAELMNTLWPPGDEERIALSALASGTSEETSSPVLHAVVSGTYPSMATPFGQAAPAAMAQTVTLPPPAVLLNEARPAPLPINTVNQPPPAALLDESRPPFIPSGVEGQTLLPLHTVNQAPSASLLHATRGPSSGSLPAVPGTISGPLPPFDTSEQPVFEEPPGSSRGWWVGLAVVVLVLVAGLGMFFKDRRPQGGASVSQTPPGAAASTSHLSVVTPVPVKVFEGKQELGTSPLELDLGPGPHTLRLSNKALGVDQTVELTFVAGQTQTLNELAKGMIAVKVVPWAYVKLDGKQLGETPISARTVYEGVHVVELNNTNLNVSRRLEVKVKAGETRVVSVNLEE